MKYLIIGLLSCSVLFTKAQAPANTLLNQSFWQQKPTVDAVKAEVAKGNNPAELNPSSFDPVVMAINAGAPTETILYLLEQKGNDVNKLTHDGRTYIFWSASRANLEVMQYLLSKGAKLDMQDSHGYSPINFAAVGGQQNTSVYDLLIEKGAKPQTELTHDGANALLLSVSNDPALKLVNYFQSKGLELNSKDAAGATAFDYAARAGNIETMKALQQKNVKFTNNALLMAAQGSRRGAAPVSVFDYLLGLGIKPAVTSKTGENVLHYIVRRPGQTELIKYFLSKGVDINQANEEGNTVFMTAAGFSRDSSTIELLKPLVKNINQANKNGQTALTLAVRNNSPYAVEYLLANGASLQTSDAKGNNLVYYLLESYNPRQAKEFEQKLALLKEKGLNISAAQKDGNNIYHLAVAKNDIALLKSLQSFGADVNAKNKEGLTPLHKAAMMSKDDRLMQYLISIGAKKDAKTNFNETAFDLARENEYLAKEKISVDFLK